MKRQSSIERAEEGVKEAIMKRQSSIEDYQEELKKEKDELDSQQEALLMMLRRRIENLQEKMKNMETEEKQKLAEGIINISLILQFLFLSRGQLLKTSFVSRN